MNGNLFELAAAYNAGPGAVTRWMAHHRAARTIRCCSSKACRRAETRDYVKARDGLSLDVSAAACASPRRSLDRPRSGKWPTLSAQARTCCATPQPRTPPVQPPMNGLTSSAMPTHRIDESVAFVPVRIAVLTVSDTRDASNDISGDTLVKRIEDAGHVARGARDRARRPDEDRRAAADAGSTTRRSMW